VLVPEISLTPQTVERFKNRFAGIQREVAVLHSHLSTGERHDEWHKVARGGARIVIGARSAIFAPLEALGLIIVDEEHEQSYKQDNVPRYHARDLAVMRAQLEQCAVLLGSATPSLESWHNARRGKYRLLELPQRIDGRRLPLMRIIDMRLEKKRGDKFAPAIFSEALRLAIDKRLARNEQVILFLNRRGYAGAIQCLSCGHVVTCPHCSVSLVFHRQPQKLVCHICGYQALPPRACPSCGDPGIRLAGYGTQRVEEAMARLFPNARAARVDTDSMARKHQLRDTLNAFQGGKIDILVGTQMIAKGLHFPRVTLVGILNADLGLHVPDFRAGERTFQLLTQVAGRAGRGDVCGEVLIQTFSPHHGAIQHARQGDFTGYAQQELEFRQALSFPPFAHAVLVTLRSEKESLAEFALKNFQQRLERALPPHIMLGDAVPSPLLRAEDQFRFQLMMRAKSTRRINDHLRAVLEKMTFPREVTVVIDVDPYNLA
jgi:primosomal protein N' (replication factor Y) (superfamily II helicase)